MKIALIGCGNWGKFILRDLVTLGCKVDVVARSKESRSRAEEGKADSIRTSIAELSSVNHRRVNAAACGEEKAP